MAGPRSAPAMTVGGPHYYALRPDSDIGGEVYERNVIERLPAAGVEVIVGLPRDNCAGGLPAGVTVDVLRHRVGLHWVTAPGVFVPYVISLLRSGRVDVLRGHSVRHTGPSLLLARQVLRSPVPVVLHHHHFFPRWRALEAAIMRRADAVITVSEHSRRELVDAGVGTERIHVIPDGVARPPRTMPRPERWPAGGLRLLHVGRLEERKRPIVAIDTVGELRRRGIAASLLLAGDGPERDALAEHAERTGVTDGVRFLGRVADEHKWQLYDSADVLLFGSTLEGFGLVVAEAQSRGLPVVAAAGSATAEALDDGRSGLLVAPTAPAFAGAVAQLADPTRRGEMGAAAAEFAARFDWDTCATRVADVYRALRNR
jgi:glycosyltransferase involved in cell wall biosynthesis